LPAKIEIQDMSGSLPHDPAQAYPTRPLTDIKRIVLHHTALTPTVSPERLATAFVNEGKPGIVYHYCVSDQGVVYQTQPLEDVSFPNQTFNRDSINICLLGDFSKAPP